VNNDNPVPEIILHELETIADDLCCSYDEYFSTRGERIVELVKILKEGDSP
jgi:hypothetical protein